MYDLVTLVQEHINQFKRDLTEEAGEARPSTPFDYSRYLYVKDAQGNTLLHVVLQTLSDLNDKEIKSPDDVKAMPVCLLMLQTLTRMGANYFMPNLAHVTPYALLKKFKPTPDSKHAAFPQYLDLTSLQAQNRVVTPPHIVFEQRYNQPQWFNGSQSLTFDELDRVISNGEIINALAVKKKFYKIHPSLPALTVLDVLARTQKFETIYKLILARKQEINELDWHNSIEDDPLMSVPQQVDDDLITRIMHGEDHSELARQTATVFPSWKLTASQDLLVSHAKREKIANALLLLDLNLDDPVDVNQGKINACIRTLHTLQQTELMGYSRIFPGMPSSQEKIAGVLRIIMTKERQDYPASNDALFSDMQLDSFNELAEYAGLGVGYFEAYRPAPKLDDMQLRN